MAARSPGSSWGRPSRSVCRRRLKVRSVPGGAPRPVLEQLPRKRPRRGRPLRRGRLSSSGRARVARLEHQLLAAPALWLRVHSTSCYSDLCGTRKPEAASWSPFGPTPGGAGESAAGGEQGRGLQRAQQKQGGGPAGAFPAPTFHCGLRPATRAIGPREGFSAGRAQARGGLRWSTGPPPGTQAPAPPVARCCLWQVGQAVPGCVWTGAQGLWRELRRGRWGRPETCVPLAASSPGGAQAPASCAASR